MNVMNYANLWNLKISRLGIGSVQFGLDYGINNSVGRVRFLEILKIFELAVEFGVNFIDTSRLYGTSEKNIGDALGKLGLVDKFVICTKLDISKNYREKSDREVLSEVNSALDKSLESLRLDRIPIYLLHVPEHRTFRDGLIWKFLQEKQQDGFIDHLGVSIVYGPEEAMEILDDPAVEAFQIPFNIFDQRWKKSGFFQKITNMSRDIALFTRSSYLQGLLVMETDKIPEELRDAIRYKHILHEISDDLGMEVKELVLRYVFSIAGITSTIVGVDSLEQFRENLSIYRKGKLNQLIMEKIESAFFDVPETIVNPVFWKGEREKYEKEAVKEANDESNRTSKY